MHCKEHGGGCYWCLLDSRFEANRAAPHGGRMQVHDWFILCATLGAVFLVLAWTAPCWP